MLNKYLKKISYKTNVEPRQIVALRKLFDNQATIPFIARYRKEATGNLDELQIQEIQTQLEYFDELEKRKLYILNVIKEQEQLTTVLEKKIEAETDADKLEDLFLPYKPQRKTRATKAIEAGLKPLADKIMAQQQVVSLQEYKKYESEVFPSIEDVQKGVIDIIADIIATNAEIRDQLRRFYWENGLLQSKTKKKDVDAGKYENYTNYSEPIKRLKMHRALAVFRGEKEEILTVSIGIDTPIIIQKLKKHFLQGYGKTQDTIIEAIEDSVKRLIHPSLENETLKKLKEQADKEAIKLFAGNLKQLLMAPPTGEKRIMAIDPGYRTGCKVVCLDAQGNLLHNETIFPHAPQKETKKAIKKIQSLTDAYQPDYIAIGNGTASKETERFIKKIKFTKDIEVFMVNEDGASVYSASKTAREEFPQYDVTVRGAISIGRRLLDPLAELIKIDPKSIGVGQYQHDVNQTALKKELDTTVFQCVNEVGVNLNTASYHLLAYVSGLSETQAKNIVAYRKEHGKFKNRKELQKVTRLGPKAFEQSAGFLRISDGENPLDNTAVHPESYKMVSTLAELKGIKKEDLPNKEISLTKAEKQKLINEGWGSYTLEDILQELKQPGRDPRGKASVFTFNQQIQTIEDLKEGMRVPGVITNITDFGAFIDIGIKQNGLLHISEIANEYVAHPSEKLHINDQLILRIKSVDLERGRIQLSLKDAKNE